MSSWNSCSSRSSSTLHGNGRDRPPEASGPEGRNTYADLALIFTSAAFALLIAMVMVQMAVRIGIGDMQAQAGDGMEEDRLKMMLTGLRCVDLGLDVAWDYFIGTAFVLTGVSGLGFGWGVPMAVVGAAIVLLNAWTFPWPPNTRDLFEVGPFAGLYILAFSTRVATLGRKTGE